MRKQRPAAADEPLTREADDAETTDYTSVGSHVASVLEAATVAANRVRDDAERDAAAKIAVASNEASKIMHEAQGLRAQAEEAARRTTERAEAFAERRRKDADAEAAAILENAEQVAARQHAEMVVREKALHESVDLAETRLRDLVGGLRRLADELDVILSAKTLADWDESPRETLDDALRESVRSE